MNWKVFQITKEEEHVKIIVNNGREPDIFKNFYVSLLQIMTKYFEKHEYDNDFNS